MTLFNSSLRRCRLGRALALGLAVCATQAAGAGVLYTCDLDAKRSLGWVSAKMSIVFQDSGKVLVADGPILHFLGEPIEVRAARQGDKVRLTWNIANAEDDRGQRVATMKYIANLDTAALTIDVTARPLGPPQRLRGKGVCEARRG